MSEKTEEEINVLLDAYGSAMDFDLESFFKLNFVKRLNGINSPWEIKYVDDLRKEDPILDSYISALEFGLEELIK